MKYLIIIMYIYHALINALNAHMIHINLTTIFYTHAEHLPKQFTKGIIWKHTHTHTHGRAPAHTHPYTHTHTCTQLSQIIVIFMIFFTCS